jgi:hypothetical protein
MLLRKTGFLEYVQNDLKPEDIGGLEIMKEWVVKRKDLFTQTAVDAGLPIPRGILIMGISPKQLTSLAKPEALEKGWGKISRN